MSPLAAAQVKHDLGASKDAYAAADAMDNSRIEVRRHPCHRAIKTATCLLKGLRSAAAGGGPLSSSCDDE